MHDAIKELLISSRMVSLLLDQHCQDIYTHGMNLISERSTRLKMTSSTSKSTTVERTAWLEIYSLEVIRIRNTTAACSVQKQKVS